MLCFLSCQNDAEETQKPFKITNSITTSIDSAANERIGLIERKKKLKEAYRLITKLKEDSLKKDHYLDLVYAYYQLPDTSRFLELNNELLELAKTTSDSSIIAKCYWRFGNFYSDIRDKKDSAFYYYNKGQEVYQSIGNKINAARLLINMAIIQKNIKDYTGSEITTTKAIALLKPIEGYGELYSSYNNLGIVFNELGEYDRAIYYHQRAIEYIEKTGLTNLTPGSLNNLGVVYSNQKNYTDAIQNFEYGLEQDSLYYHNPKLYAMLLDNFAYAKFKSKDTTANLPTLFYNALKIRDSLYNTAGITTSKLHLAEYFIQKNDTSKGIEYAREVKELSEQSNNFKDLLSSLLILSRVERDSALAYTNKYIKINDSLQKVERSTRNKFARIRFETDEYISETEKLNQRVLRVSLISLGVLLILVLLYIIKDQKSKNKVIKLKQSANQEIYNLILAQQKNFEEGREKEKQHISRELHDGILGKLFGVRLSLDSLNEDDHKDIKKKRYEYIEEIQAIAEEIRLISHKLNKSSIIDVDFKIVVEELIKKQHQAIQLNVDSSIGWDDIGNDIKINFYRIIQEAINNIQKHSKATEVKVEIRKSGNKLILQVRDNGIGFNTGKLKNGIGLKNMKTRSQDINGSFLINSNSKGTLIEVTVNIKKL